MQLIEHAARPFRVLVVRADWSNEDHGDELPLRRSGERSRDRTAARRRRHRTPRGRERRILSKDPTLETLQLRAGVQPELFDEEAACLVIGLERFRLPPIPVERQHQLPAKALTERFACNERLELRNHRDMPAGSEIGVDPVGDRR